MSVERIREVILAEARGEADSIESEARRRHDERLEAARKQIEQEFQRRFEQAERRARQDSERRVLHRRSEHNLALLQQRNTILDDLFRQAGEQLRDLPDEQYRELIGAWMEEIPPDAAGQVFCHRRDEGRLRPLLDGLNGSRGADARLDLQPGDGPETGGVIFRAEKFEIDLSVDTRLASLREELAPEIARRVFGKQTGV